MGTVAGAATAVSRARHVGRLRDRRPGSGCCRRSAHAYSARSPLRMCASSSPTWPRKSRPERSRLRRSTTRSERSSSVSTRSGRGGPVRDASPDHKAEQWPLGERRGRPTARPHCGLARLAASCRATSFGFRSSTTLRLLDIPAFVPLNACSGATFPRISHPLQLVEAGSTGAKSCDAAWGFETWVRPWCRRASAASRSACRRLSSRRRHGTRGEPRPAGSLPSDAAQKQSFAAQRRILPAG